MILHSCICLIRPTSVFTVMALTKERTASEEESQGAGPGVGEAWYPCKSLARISAATAASSLSRCTRRTPTSRKSWRTRGHPLSSFFDSLDHAPLVPCRCRPLQQSQKFDAAQAILTSSLEPSFTLEPCPCWRESYSQGCPSQNFWLSNFAQSQTV